MIIVLEGIDNAGKTIISDMLLEYFLQLGIQASISKELTTKVGDIIKSSIKNEGLSPISKTFLFAADRQIRLEQLNTSNENVIIFDRYLHSAVVYREAEGLDETWVKEINRNIPQSDFAFYIDITPEKSIARNTDSKFNIHYSLAHLKNVRDSYLRYVELGELILIDGMREARAVFEDIVQHLK